MWIDSIDYSWSDGYYSGRINDNIQILSPKYEIYYDSVRIYDGLSEIPSQVSDAIYYTFDADHNFESASDWGNPIDWNLQ